MILLTGDIHGDVRSPLWVIQRHGLTPDDLLILLGDVGLNYYGADQGDRKRKKLLNKAGVPIFWMISRIFCLQRMAKSTTWMGKSQL